VAEAVATSLHGAPSGTVLLYGGETTVTITGHGVGGRNQELVLAAVPLLAEGEAIISLASDGHDNSDHAGAIADATSVEKAKSKNLDASAYLADNNSFTFFHLLEDALVTGYTGANIADLVIAIKRT
jgi:glycerate-2-kinase